MTLSFDKVNRVITILEPDTEITIQNLLNSIRQWEDELSSMDMPRIASCAGKEPLGGGVKVGLTLTLLDNWRLAFAPREGPNYTQCQVNGGNIVGSHINGSIYPTAFTQIVVTASSSATLQEQGAIEFGSFNGGVTYMEASPYSGTKFPVGTPQEPVNNTYDAKTIAIERGFTTGFIIGDMNIPTDLEISGFSFIGSGKDRTNINIPDLALVENCTYMDSHVTGYLDGANTIIDCLIDNLHYIKGYIEGCVLSPGVITLGGNDTAHFLDCFSGVPGTGTPTIDLAGSGQALAMRNYNGGIKLINKTGTESVSIDLNSGQVKLDLTTVTDGVIVVRGIGKVIEATSGEHLATGYFGSLYLLNEAINRDNISSAVWDEYVGDHLIQNTTGHKIYHDMYDEQIFIDTVGGESGTEFPIGTKKSPVDNLADAITIMNEHNWNDIHIIGNLTIAGGEDISRMTFHSDRSLGNSITITDAITDHTYFEDLTISGTLAGKTRFTYCVLGELNGFNGGAKNCLLTSNIYFVGSEVCYFTDCDNYITDIGHIELHQYSSSLNLIKCRGRFGIYNKTSTNKTAIDLVAGYVYVDTSCNAGTISIGGIGYVDDQSSSGCEVFQGSIDDVYISNAVWDEPISEHSESGSTGLALSTASSGGVDVNLLAAAVWDHVDGNDVHQSVVGKAIIIPQGDDSKIVNVYDEDGNTILYSFAVSANNNQRVPI